MAPFFRRFIVSLEIIKLIPVVKFIIATEQDDVLVIWILGPVFLSLHHSFIVAVSFADELEKFFAVNLNFFGVNARYFKHLVLV